MSLVEQPGPAAAAADVFPLTVSQRRLWQAARARPDDTSLNIAARWRLEGLIDPARIEQAARRLVARHEALRTRFVEQGGVPVQEVLPDPQFRLAEIDLRALREADRLDEAARLARAEATTPFDITAPPLLRLMLVRIEDRVADILVTTHHLVGDCWSNGTLAREMADMLDGPRDGAAELPLQFGDYARWHGAWMEAGGHEPHRAYWTRRLAGFRGVRVPTDRPVPAVPRKGGDIVATELSRSIGDRAAARARALGATFFTLGVAAFAALLHRWTGADDVLFGTQVAGRDEVETEPVVGPFINTLALRLPCRADMRFDELLAEARAAVGEALEHAAFPMEELPPAVTTAADGRRPPVEAVNFIVQRAFTRETAGRATRLRGVPNASPGAKHELNLFLVERPAGWRASCEYDTDLFDRATAERLLDAFLTILDRVSEQPEIPLSALPAVTRTEPRPAAPGAALLLSLWAEALGRVPASPAEDFFVAGGDSLRAARLVARIGDAFGTPVGLGEMFRAPTPAGIAARLGIVLDGAIAAPAAPAIRPAADVRGPAAPPARPEAPASGSDWRVVELRATGSGTPIIGINNVGILHALARRSGLDRRMLCLRLFEPGRPHGIDGLTLAEIAARYVALLRGVQPTGPYVLLGECVHGVLAWAVAQQLLREGERVEAVLAVNMWHPAYARSLGWRQRWQVRIGAVSDNFRRVLRGEKTLLAFAGGYSLPHRLGLFRAARRLGLIREIPSRTGHAASEDFLLTLVAARDAYRPGALPVRLLQMLTPDTPRGPGFDPTLGWEGLADALAVRAVAAPQGASPGPATIAETMTLALSAPALLFGEMPGGAG
jgi:thioesterase domain-containing protein